MATNPFQSPEDTRVETRARWSWVKAILIAGFSAIVFGFTCVMLAYLVMALMGHPDPPTVQYRLTQLVGLLCLCVFLLGIPITFVGCVAWLVTRFLRW